GKLSPVNITIAGDMPEVRPKLTNVGGRLRSAHISPTGARAVFEARGEIVTVPAEKGDPRNLTGTPAGMERDPAWSPAGKWIAYTKHLPNYLGAIFLYSLADAKSTQMTDGLSDANHAEFDKDGKYLYFTASTNVGPTLEPDIQSIGKSETRSIYLAVLSKADP